MLTRYSIYNPKNPDSPRAVYVSDEDFSLEACAGQLIATAKIPPMKPGQNSAELVFECGCVLVSRSHCIAVNRGEKIVQTIEHPAQFPSFLREIGEEQVAEENRRKNHVTVVLPSTSRRLGFWERLVEWFKSAKPSLLSRKGGCASCSPGAYVECSMCDNADAAGDAK